MKAVLILAVLGFGLQLQAAEMLQTYKVTIKSNWNKADHVSVPSSAHFSPVVAVTHNHLYDLVPVGGITNNNLEPLAELGRTARINNEIDDEKMAGNVGNSITTANQFVINEPEQTFEITVSSKFPYLSLVSMIAPSPDWIVAVSGLKLYSEAQGFHAITAGIPLYALNAGTENGDRGGNYSINNNPTNPQESIQLLKGRGFSAPFAFVTIEPMGPVQVVEPVEPIQ